MLSDPMYLNESLAPNDEKIRGGGFILHDEMRFDTIK